jgi:Rrf2 family nitric oxide-sensitive transcriptional repressor
MYLASQPDRQVTLRELASTYGISLDHLRKVVSRLAHLGLIDSRQGRSGGLRLGAAADTIRVGQVVRQMESGNEVIDCEGRKCVLVPGCALRLELSDALASFYARLDEKTIADLLGSRNMQQRLIALRPTD